MVNTAISKRELARTPAPVYIFGWIWTDYNGNGLIDEDEGSFLHGRLETGYTVSLWHTTPDSDKIIDLVHIEGGSTEKAEFRMSSIDVNAKYYLHFKPDEDRYEISYVRDQINGRYYDLDENDRLARASKKFVVSWSNSRIHCRILSPQEMRVATKFSKWTSIMTGMTLVSKQWKYRIRVDNGPAIVFPQHRVSADYDPTPTNEQDGTNFITSGEAGVNDEFHQIKIDVVATETGIAKNGRSFWDIWITCGDGKARKFGKWPWWEVSVSDGVSKTALLGFEFLFTSEFEVGLPPLPSSWAVRIQTGAL